MLIESGPVAGRWWPRCTRARREQAGGGGRDGDPDAVPPVAGSYSRSALKAPGSMPEKSLRHVVSSSTPQPGKAHRHHTQVQTVAMGIRPVRPSAARLETLRTASADAAVTYEPIGSSHLSVAPPGYRLDRWERDLGAGDATFETAGRTLLGWGVHRGAGLLVQAPGPASPGLVVAMAAPLPVGWVEVMCRVVDVTRTAERVGFTYGTLPGHPEQGEESFTVVRHGDRVRFEIAACSRPRHPLARLAPPVARLLQRAATTRYLDAMQAAVAHPRPA